MKASVNFPIIAVMRSPFKEKFGIPRQPNLVDVPCYIEMNAPYIDKMAFNGIEAFSHLWLLWVFHDNKKQRAFKPQVRPPRLGGNQKVGVFATRSMYRPANIGLSVVKLIGVDQQKQGIRLCVTGSDLLDGTPILDIKPYITYSDAVLDAQSGYALEPPLVKQVFWHTQAMTEREILLKHYYTSEQELKYLEQVLALDPKPAYQKDVDRVYAFKFFNLEVKFKVSLENIFIVALQYIDWS